MSTPTPRPLTRLLILLVTALTLNACGDPDEVDLEVRGIITDAETEAPLEGVSISLLWSPELYDIAAVGTESGPDGTYLLTVFKLPCDGPRLLVSLEPYAPEQRNVRCTAEPQQIDVALRR
jgi:hypothetical protein